VAEGFSIRHSNDLASLEHRLCGAGTLVRSQKNASFPEEYVGFALTLRDLDAKSETAKVERIKARIQGATRVRRCAS
jgi:hypothetical protein